MTPPYAGAVFVALLLVVLVAELTVLLVIQRLVASLRNARTARRMRRVAPSVHAAVLAEGDVGPLGARLTRGDRPVVREMLLHLALDLGGAERRTIAALYRRLGLLDDELRALEHGRAARRAAAAASLGLVGGAAACPPLIRALEDRRPRVRLAAVRSLGEIGGLAALRALVPRLGDADGAVGQCACAVLAESGGPELAPDVLAFARATASADGRRRALGLIALLEADAYEEISAALASPDGDMRTAATRAAASAGDPRFYARLVGLLGDPNVDVGCQAARGLGRLGSADAIPALAAVLRATRSWWLRLHVAAALDELGGAGRGALRAALGDAQGPVRDCARYVIDGGNAMAAAR
ncbi:MAG TPA: HEAT repeat domain-containing protein [Terriglobales bacterium]|nr:HEAT repeat domain-containing protein [Terriglobales bacterium]